MFTDIKIITLRVNYRPIGIALASQSPFAPHPGGAVSLYNGNIARHAKSMATDGYAESVLDAKYDQLNRLTEATDESRYGSNYRSTNKFLGTYTYDGNGNLELLDRDFTYSGQRSQNKLEYGYSDGTNRLSSVTPRLNSNPAQSPARPVKTTQTYNYDGAGNLILQKDGTLNSQLSWNAYGKVRSIYHWGGCRGCRGTD